MNACASDVDLELPPEPGSVAEARHAVRELARAVGSPEHQVALAVSEAVSNAIVHAFRRGKEGSVRIRAQLIGGELLVTVADNGVGMIPDLDSPGLGVGTSLISRLSDQATFESSDDGTTVTMRFKATEGSS
ncbi:MAG: serine/threonine-protein kinase RsbW [Solirubrobacterales bacterium]|jgi:serine/threonine-protein kinase RsbW/stage II sporulation protein AB (anti-sigma F factor)|nr:serine/threonine-protein kinase RsbW [Solirubrobacterales bacterium]